MNNQTLRVAQLVETMTMGGAENLAVRIANALAREGHESHLIVITEPGILSDRVDPEVKVHYLGFWRSSIRNPLAFLISLRRGQSLLSSLIRAEGIQVLQTHLPGANFWGLLLELKKACPVFATIHNNQEFRYGAHDNPLLSRFRKTAYKQIIGKCHGVIAVSEKVKNSLIDDLGLSPGSKDRISVVANGVEIPVPLPPSIRTDIRKNLAIKDDLPLILAAGRLGDQKNFADLIQAASNLHQRGAAFQLVIAGEGEHRTCLEGQVSQLGLEEVVYLPGNLVNLNQVMLAADIFAMSSLWEGLPLVLLEAMAAGLPAAAYGIPGVEELIHHGENGCLAAPGKPALLADGLATLLDEPARRMEMGGVGRLFVEEHYNFERVIAELGRLYLTARE